MVTPWVLVKVALVIALEYFVAVGANFEVHTAMVPSYLRQARFLELLATELVGEEEVLAWWGSFQVTGMAPN